MASMDVFRGDAFSAIQMTRAADKVPYLPAQLGALNIFGAPTPITTLTVMVEEREGKLSLIGTLPRAAPVGSQDDLLRKARSFIVPRLAKQDTLYAHQIAGIREFGTDNELVQVQTEVARRQMRLMQDLEYTMEYHRLGAIQGKLIDADGSTVLYNWFTEFGVSEPAELDFDLDNATPASGALVKQCNAVVRGMFRASMGAILPNSEIYAACGDAFWDDLINHKDVVRTYEGWQAATALRDGNAFSSKGMFEFGGIRWFNYRSSDDTTTISVGTDKVRFFPVNAPDVFELVHAPHDSMTFVNTPGRPVYVTPEFDPQQDPQWWRHTMNSSPLHICKRPGVLWRGRRT